MNRIKNLKIGFFGMSSIHQEILRIFVLTGVGNTYLFDNRLVSLENKSQYTSLFVDMKENENPERVKKT